MTMLKLTKTEAPEIGANIRKHQHDNPTFAMFLYDIAGDVMTEMVKMGRLAMRHEGEHWNAYYALPDSMEGAIWLGSIAMRFVQTEKRRNHFMSMMRDCVADLLEELTGHRPTWPDGVQAAPEHERSRS